MIIFGRWSCCAVGLILIARIFSISSSTTSSRSFCMSHYFLSLSKNWLTLIPAVISRRGLGARGGWLGIHGSSHMLTSEPSPMIYLSPLVIRSRPCNIDFQQYDAFFFKVALSISPSGNYLAGRTLAIKQFGFCIILHNCLLSRVWFKISKSKAQIFILYSYFPYIILNYQIKHIRKSIIIL